MINDIRISGIYKELLENLTNMIRISCWIESEKLPFRKKGKKKVIHHTEYTQKSMFHR